MNIIPTQVHQSRLTGKLIDFDAINTDTPSNKFCYDRYHAAKAKNEAAGKVVDICGICYSYEALNGGYRARTMRPALQRNTVLAERLLQNNELITTLKSFYRFDAHGELLTEEIDPETGETIRKFGKFTHISNLCRIAEHNPHCTFALWTKRTDICKPFFDQHAKPSNLILIYSNPSIDRIVTRPPKHFDKVFNNVSADKFTDQQNCTGQKCRDCLACYKFGGTDIIVEAIKKNGRTRKLNSVN